MSKYIAKWDPKAFVAVIRGKTRANMQIVVDLVVADAKRPAVIQNKAEILRILKEGK